MASPAARVAPATAMAPRLARGFPRAKSAALPTTATATGSIPATSDAVPGLLCVIQPVFTMIAASV